MAGNITNSPCCENISCTKHSKPQLKCVNKQEVIVSLSLASVSNVSLDFPCMLTVLQRRSLVKTLVNIQQQNLQAKANNYEHSPRLDIKKYNCHFCLSIIICACFNYIKYNCQLYLVFLRIFIFNFGLNQLPNYSVLNAPCCEIRSFFFSLSCRKKKKKKSSVTRPVYIAFSFSFPSY